LYDGDYYVYGLGLIAKTDSQDGQLYYLTDGLASTTGLTDGEANLVGTYTYDVFGAIRSETGGQANDYRFTGQQLDVASGLYYLRARYYDPSIGRFLTQDPFPGTGTKPQTQNSYVYVSNNCVSMVDPQGLAQVGPPPPDARLVCVSWIEVWDLGGGILDVGPVKIPPSFKLFRFELHALYYRYGDDVVLHSGWADETHLGEGWHIDRSSLKYGPKEGGGAMASARFGAGGLNPWGFWPWGFNTDVELRQWIDPLTGEITSFEDATHNPFLFPLVKTKSGFKCTELP
jgi:RHS repeat-associated protein